MKSTSRTLVYGAVIFAVVFVLLDPFKVLGGGSPKPPVPRLDQADLAGYSVEYQNKAQDPVTAIGALFDNHQVVLAGVYKIPVTEEFTFLKTLVPTLPAHGVYNVGVDFLLSKDQDKIDAILTAPAFDDKAVQEVLMNRWVWSGYRPYPDLMREIWKYNSERPAQSPSMRLIALSSREDFSTVQSQDDFKKPEVIKAIYKDGAPDKAMAESILRVISDKKNAKQSGKILAIVQRDASLTSFADPNYQKTFDQMGMPNEKPLGVTLAETLPAGSVATVLFHNPWTFAQSGVGETFPVNGVFDLVMKNLAGSGSARLPAAFDLQSSSFGTIKLVNSPFYKYGADGKPVDALLLRDLAQIYVVLGPITSLHPALVIDQFVTSANLKDALASYPPYLAEKMTAQEIMNQLVKLSVQYQQLFATFALQQ